MREFHCKIVKFLVENHDTILLPKFETKSMVNSRAKRRIRSKTARAMMTWSPHYRFKTRLQNKTREYPGCKVMIVDEHYTSKTCGKCGKLNEKLGSSKTFLCPSCNFNADRDIQAARNILLRFITMNQQTSLSHSCGRGVEATLLH